MRIIAFSTLRAFADVHPQAQPALLRWHRTIKGLAPNAMSDLQVAFPKAKVLNGDRVRFAIAGGQYRLIAAFDFEKQIAFVKFSAPIGNTMPWTPLPSRSSRRLSVEIRPIRSDADHRDALQEIERLWGSSLGTPEGDKLELLATLVEAYENAHHPVEAADPVEILHFAIQDMGRSQADLARLLGSRARASEVLNRKRLLSLAQIRVISAAWHLPIALLAAPYRLERDAA